MRTGRFARISGLAVIAALLCIIVTVSTAYADAYDTAVGSHSPATYLPLNESATPFHDTVGSRTCAWSGSGVAHSSDGPGSAGASALFSGGNCHYSGSVALTSGALSVVWWTKGAAGGSGSVAPIAEYCTAGGTGPCATVMMETSAHELIIQEAFGSSFGTVTSGSNSDVVDATNWHMWAVVASGTTVTFYEDGTAFGSTGTASSAPTAITSASAYIGARPDINGDTFTGKLARYAWFNSALSSSDLTSLFGASTSGPPANMTITPGFLTEPIGATWTWTLLSTDATGADVTGSSVYSIVDATGLTCDGVSVWPHTLASNTAVCTYTGTAGGDFVVHFADTAHSLNAFGLVTIVGSVNRFTLGYALPVPFVIGQQGTFYSSAYDAQGRDVSATDPFVVAAAAHQTCGAVTQHFAGGVGEYYQVTCSWDAAGDYTLSATDAQGFPTSVRVHVDPASTAATCGSTDLGCWLNQLWDAISSLAQIPFQMVSGLVSFLTVSQTGKSYIDTSAVTSGAFLPSVTCRSGQAPTAPDGVHCFPFPISLPFDVQTVFNLINVSPTAPSFSVSWTFTFMGTAIPVTHAFDVSAILNDSFMTYVRGAELVVFIIGTAFGTWRFVNLVGAI